MRLNYVISDSIQSSLIEIIETAYRSIPTNFFKIYYQSQSIGAMSPSCFNFIKETLFAEDNDFSLIQVTHDSLVLSNGSSHDLSLELQILAEVLRNKGILSHWRNEKFSFLREDNHEIFQLERAAFRGLGLMSTAVHINGFTEDGSIWLARRSDSKSVDPGLIDNMTAGGVNAHETIQSCAERELWEEAGVLSSQLKNLYPAGLIEVRRPLPPHEIHHEKLFTFDLMVDSIWSPSNQDGEVQNFQKYVIEEVVELILSEKMTQDAAVVTADFILRNVKKE